jgi:proline iminopeptidase
LQTEAACIGKHPEVRKGNRHFIFTAALVQGIASVLIHGRLDVSGPLHTAWQLHQSWNESRLIVVETEGHGGSAMANEFAKAIAGF